MIAETRELRRRGHLVRQGPSSRGEEALPRLGPRQPAVAADQRRSSRNHCATTPPSGGSSTRTRGRGSRSGASAPRRAPKPMPPLKEAWRPSAWRCTCAIHTQAVPHLAASDRTCWLQKSKALQDCTRKGAHKRSAPARSSTALRSVARPPAHLLRSGVRREAFTVTAAAQSQCAQPDLTCATARGAPPTQGRSRPRDLRASQPAISLTLGYAAPETVLARS